MNPLRRPTRVIQIDAGMVNTTVPRNIVAMGAVASSGFDATIAPAKPAIVITRTEAV
jgi:stage V sporulation protein SpoVS